MLSRRHGPFYSEAEKPRCRVVIVGAGPAGLLAATKRAPYRGARDLADKMIMVRMAAEHRKRGHRGQSFVEHVSCNTKWYSTTLFVASLRKASTYIAG